MYKLSVPIMNHLATDETREEYLKQFKECGVDRVFLSLGHGEEILPKNIEYFKSHGFEVGIWIGQTIGHGGTLAEPRVSKNGVPFKMLKGTANNEIGSTACPLDGDFVADFCERIKSLAKAGADTIMLDDDFRLSQHGSGFCCVCDMHMKKMSELCGEELRCEDVYSKVFTGKPNKYRDAWIKAQGDSLYSLAEHLRAAVDEVDPKIRIGICVAHSVWNIDGVDVLKLTKILAGNNTPLLRLHPAPYWGVKNMPLVSVFEAARMLVSFVDDETFELMPEGDVYPRPRYSTPSSYLELFDAVVRADGKHGGDFKYMFDYNSAPDYEQGYIKSHLYYLNAQKEISRIFEEGNTIGVRIHERRNMLAHTDFELSMPSDRTPYPWAGVMMARCGIPTAYEGEGICDAVFGENARYFDLATAKNGVIIDGTAAAIFAERGFDVGLSEINGFSPVTVSCEYFGDYKVKVNSESIRFLNAKLSDNTKTLSSVCHGDSRRSTAYMYENADGIKLLVYTFDSSSLSQYTEMLCTYARAEQISYVIENFFGRTLPIKMGRDPEVYVMCKKNDTSTSLLLANCFADPVLEPCYELDSEYRSAEFVNCNGTVEGNILKLDAPINAYSFVGVKLTK